MKFYAKKQVINMVTGEPFETQGPKGKPMPLTVGWAAMEVLLGRINTDQSAPPALKVHRYKIAGKIKDFLESKAGDEQPMDIPAEDLGMIKSRVLEAFDTGVAGKWCELVERESPTEVKKV